MNGLLLVAEALDRGRGDAMARRGDERAGPTIRRQG
jgi:hypothetical protein